MRKIKRSEYLKEREEYWRSSTDTSGFAHRDAAVLDDVDYPWEPEEEEPWPEEVAYAEDADGNPYLVPVGISPLHGWGSPERRRSSYMEAARRWRGYAAAVTALRSLSGRLRHGSADRAICVQALDRMGEEEVPK